jgi:hypothetical protein
MPDWHKTKERTMDMTGILMLLALYVAYRVGRWQERTETERLQAEAGAARLADEYDGATRRQS